MKFAAFSRRILASLILLGSLGSTASAQYWGGGGGSTIEGDYLRGLGFAAAGMGLYNQRTAIADSINLDTFIRWNEYMAAVANERVLTVGETDDFLKAGGAVCFSFERETLQFEVNLAAASGAGLKVSSRLLSLARRVVGSPEAAKG